MKKKQSSASVLAQLGRNQAASQSGRAPSSHSFGLRRQSAFHPPVSKGISFGHAPKTGSTGASSSSGELAGFIKGAAHGVLSGSGLLHGSLLGFAGSLLSSLFGSHHSNNTPSVAPFVMPGSVAASIDIQRGNVAALSGVDSHSANTVASAPTAPAHPVAHGDIANAVKLALLHSHSLADVINEL